MNIDEQIKYEREALAIAIFPRERREHAEKLAKLIGEKTYPIENEKYQLPK